MAASSSSSSSSSSSASSPLSFNPLTFFQYVVFAAVAYVLAGAPFLSDILAGTSLGRTKEIGNRKAKQYSYERIESLMVPDPKLVCEEEPGYNVHVLSREPLVIYVEGFLSEEERRHVVEISTPNFTPSSIWTNNAETIDPSIRRSEKSPLDPSDPVIACIASRARSFQGWRPNVFVEKPWAQRYFPGGHYTHHFDFSNPGPGRGRVSTFMVYVEANCTGGGTNFPRLKKPVGREWCRFLECGEDGEGEGGEELVDGRGEKVEGVTFKAISGNAVFWENLREDGSGYWETWHAGLPVKSGVKIGLNIWSWLQEGYEIPVEEEVREIGE